MSLDDFRITHRGQAACGIHTRPCRPMVGMLRAIGCGPTNLLSRTRVPMVHSRSVRRGIAECFSEHIGLIVRLTSAEGSLCSPPGVILCNVQQISVHQASNKMWRVELVIWFSEV
jgi:hypothetical protein